MQAYLQDATRTGDLSKVNNLLGKRPELFNAVDARLGVTPLHEASRHGHTKVVSYLLDHGADINQRAVAPAGMTALHLACCQGRVEVMKLLLERDADPTIATLDGVTPLMSASILGFVDCVESLLTHGEALATIDIQTKDGSALVYACRRGHVEVVKALLKAGADPLLETTGDITPLSAARSMGHCEIVRLLEVSGHPHYYRTRMHH